MSIEALQESMVEQEQVVCPVNHYFSDGIYARELTIPAGVCIVGARHKTRHFFQITEGDCLISDGENSMRVKAPYMTETKPGTKRAITAIKDTVVTTFHVTSERDIEKIGDNILEPEGKILPQWKTEALEGR